MADDLTEQLRTAAASPTRDAPLPLIEARLRRRRRNRRGGAALSTIALVVGIGGIVLSGNDQPSVRTGTAAAATTIDAHTEPSVTVELPDGWVVSDGNRYDHEILAVGTATQPTGEGHSVCQPDPAYADDVFVILREYTHLVLALEALEPTQPLTYNPTGSYNPNELGDDRPADFATAMATTWACDFEGGELRGLKFRDQGRYFGAEVGFGPAAPPERRAEAYAVLNSLVVEAWPTPEPQVPVTTVPPVTVPPSADTEAITAAFLGWIDTRPIDASGAYIEDFASIREAVIGAAAANGRPDEYTGRVDAITRVGENDADVIYSFIIDGQPVVAHLTGRAVKIDGVWLVSRDTVCEALLMGPVHCPPRE